LKAYAVAAGEETEVVTHTYTYETPQATPIIVSFQKPNDWSTVNLYAWTMAGTPINGSWPGSEMKNVNAAGLYYHQFEATVKEVNFIFNNGASTQSTDLWTDEDVCYGWENKAAVLIDCPATDVENVQVETIPALDITQPMYNMLGQQVGAEYQGVVIQNGHKYLR
jgi:hypothetical protein